MTIKNKSFKLLSYIVFTFILITTTVSEYRPIDGKGNNLNNPSAGIPGTSFVRSVPSSSFFDVNNNMIQTAGNYNVAPPAATLTCADNSPAQVFPLPRCVSNKLMSTRSKDDDMFDLGRLEKFKSKRKISHMVSVFIIP